METVNAVPLIKFWLAVENFRVSAQTMIELQATSTSNSTHNCDIEDRPLTDDEKSEIIQKDKKGQKQKSSSSSPTASTRSKRNSQFQTTVATDALKILEKFLCANSESYIDLDTTIHSKISLSMGNCDESTSLVSPDCFNEAQQFVLDRLDREYLKQFLDSEYYCKYCLEVLTGGDLQLSDILYSESALFYFMEFLEQEQCRDYLDFWMSATNFRRHSMMASEDTPSSSSLSQVAASDAMVLYEKYFSLQATNPLKLSDSVRSVVEECICSQSENLLPACFDLPIRIVERLFTKCYLDRFVASDLFFKHISDLVNRSQQQQSTGKHPKVVRTQSLTKDQRGKSMHRRINSEGGLDGNILRRSNSTVSVASSTGDTMKLGSTVELRIDSRMFCNGDLLYRKSGSGGSKTSLSFGRVNALGRFERDFDWEEGSSSGGQGGASGCGGSHVEESAGSRLKKAVKKLVNLTEDKVQEELAWQVAEMIIKDVTDITLSGEGGMMGRDQGIGMGRSFSSGVMVVEEE